MIRHLAMVFLYILLGTYFFDFPIKKIQESRNQQRNAILDVAIYWKQIRNEYCWDKAIYRQHHYVIIIPCRIFFILCLCKVVSCKQMQY